MSLADLAHLVEQPEWMESAACRNLDSRLFFPKKQQKAADAKAICRTCAVQTDCLDYALSFPSYYDFGIYGGTNAYERKVMRQRRTG